MEALPPVQAMIAELAPLLAAGLLFALLLGLWASRQQPVPQARQGAASSTCAPQPAGRSAGFLHLAPPVPEPPPSSEAVTGSPADVAPAFAPPALAPWAFAHRAFGAPASAFLAGGVPLPAPFNLPSRSHWPRTYGGHDSLGDPGRDGDRPGGSGGSVPGRCRYGGST